ncbi:hypothetical protein DL546_002856 [Coniochaeta pulveracea]|uniref:Uncharacterized protein n=1 Tax=Coniochaeta pulveracea TaxID=177199 RepID=A0A420YBY7_9PEZI|nr:hypothetical protein DL546_002856 [Coniochaeta pulveracea]
MSTRSLGHSQTTGFQGRENDGHSSHQTGDHILQTPKDQSNPYQADNPMEAYHGESQLTERPWRIESYSKARMEEALDERRRETWQWLFEMARNTRRIVEELRGKRLAIDSRRSATADSVVVSEAPDPPKFSARATSLTGRREGLLALEEEQSERWIHQEIISVEELDSPPPLHGCVLGWICSLRQSIEEQIAALQEHRREEEEFLRMSNPGNDASSRHDGSGFAYGSEDEDGSDSHRAGSEKTPGSDIPSNSNSGGSINVTKDDEDGHHVDGSDGSNSFVILTPSTCSAYSETDVSNPSLSTP